MKPLQRPLWVLASLEGKSKMFSGETVEDQESNAAKFKAGLVEYYKENPKGRGKNRYSANNFVRIKSCSNSGWIGKRKSKFRYYPSTNRSYGEDATRFDQIRGGRGGVRGSRGDQAGRGGPGNDRRCHRCHQLGHLIASCPQLPTTTTN